MLSNNATIEDKPPDYKALFPHENQPPSMTVVTETTGSNSNLVNAENAIGNNSEQTTLPAAAEAASVVESPNAQAKLVTQTSV